MIINDKMVLHTSVAGDCWLAMYDKQSVRVLQLLQGGEELAGGLPGRVHAPAHGPRDGRRDGLRLQSPDRAQHEVPVDGGSEEV